MNYINKLFLTLCLLVGCSEQSFTKEEKIPIDKFVFIQQDLNVDFCILETDVCMNTDIQSSGSGFFVNIDYTYEMSYIMTADHICNPENYSLSKYNNSGFFPNIIRQTITASNSLGEVLNAKIFKYDNVNDLCLLTVDSVSIEPMKLSQTNPEPMDKIINIAAPSSVWEPGAVIVFDGRYSGTNKLNQYVYSMPTHPGSSGSPILNEENEFIGIISMASSNLSIGYGATRNSIEKFLISFQ